VVFEFDRRKVAEGRTESYRVVKGLDVIKEGGLGLLEVQGDLVVEALSLEGGPEALHGGIIVTASLPAHAGADLAGVQQLAEGTGGVLNSSIRMMNLGSDVPEFAGTLESLMNHRRGQRSRQFPAQEAFGTKIEFRGQIKPAILLGRQIS
jgi:hypothetical protein